MPRDFKGSENLWLISSRRHYCDEQVAALAMACLLVDSPWLTVAVSYLNDLVKVSFPYLKLIRISTQHRCNSETLSDWVELSEC